MEHKKVIILVAADGDGYQDLVQSIKETWGSTKLEGFEILYYYGYRKKINSTPGQCIQCADELICGVERHNIHARNEIAFKYIYNNYDFEYLFRCCAGSYIVQEKMAEFLQDKPKNNFYCGRIHQQWVTFYAAGYGFFLSKDLVQLFVNTPSGFYCYPSSEDVVIGHFLGQKGITIIDAPRQQFENGIIPYLNRNVFHYHLGNNLSIKKTLMHEVHRRVTLEL
jgi:hypothetical protein